jgi:hypothetical protein
MENFMAGRTIFIEDINPFFDIIESRKTPNARTLRTSWWQKMKDTFFVFHGGGARSTTMHVGLFDYLTLLLSVVLKNWFFWSMENLETNGWAAASVLPAGLLFGLVFVASIVVSSICTLLASPVVTAVHAISHFFFSKTLKEDAMALKGHSTKSSYEHSLSDYLLYNDVGVEELDVKVKKTTNFIGTPNGYQLQFFHPDKDKVNWYNVIGRAKKSYDRAVGTVPFTVGVDETNEKQQRHINALFQLNVGHVVTNIEEDRVNKDTELVTKFMH